MVVVSERERERKVGRRDGGSGVDDECDARAKSDSTRREKKRTAVVERLV